MKKILIAGVKKANPEHLATLLQCENLSISLAHTGKEAIELLSSGTFHVVLLDLDSSDIGGNEVLNAIRKAHPSSALPVIVLAGERDENQIIKLYNQGANEVITKPFLEKLLKIKVENLLKLQAHSEEIAKQNEVLKEAIDNNPILSLIVNDDVRVLNANKAFSELIDPDRLNFRGELLGNVVECIHAVESNGNCGKTPDCKGCVVRNSVNETMQTGKSIGKREGFFNIKDANSVKQLTLKVSTTGIEYQGTPGVLLYIDDITPETQHLKEIEETNELYQAQSKELSELLAKLNDANLKLEERKAYYKIISDNSNNWEVFRDPNDKLLYCSPSVEKLTGYKVEEYTKGIPFSQFIHPDDLEHFLAERKKSIAGEPTHYPVHRMITKNNRIVWAETISQPVYSNSGEILGTRVSIQDITQLKETEQALEESRELLNLIFHYSNDWEIYRDKNNKLVYCSQAIEPLLGYTVEEYMAGGISFKDFMHPDDYELIATSLQRIFAGETIPAITVRYIRKNKEIVWVSVSGRQVISQTGEILGYRFSAKDINKLKETELALIESEARYKLISDYSYAWETYRKPDGKLVYCSPGVERLLGYTVEEYIRDEKVFQIAYPEDYKIFELVYRRMLAGETIPSAVFRLVKKSGEVIWADLSIQPVHSETGEFLGSRISIRDITRLKETEFALKESEDNYKAAEHIAHIGHFDYDWMNDETTWSEELFRIYGIDPEKSGPTYEAFLNVVHPEDLDLVKETYQKSLRNEETDEIQFRLLFCNIRSN